MFPFHGGFGGGYGGYGQHPAFVQHHLGHQGFAHAPGGVVVVMTPIGPVLAQMGPDPMEEAWPSVLYTV